MDRLQLKRATEAERQYVRQVQHAAYKEMVLRQFGSWDLTLQDGFFDRSWHDAPREIILFDGQACGFCRIDEHPDCLQLVEFAIDVARQGQGIGSTFLTHFKDLAFAKRKRAQLNVMLTNLRAKALYERCGFKVYGQNAVHFLMRSEFDGTG
jgi:ribosomal protein S18 acetylase RimI-like enzyme